MTQDLFYKLGYLICKLRWVIVIAWLGIFIACLPFAPHLTDPFKALGFKDSQSESAKASQMLNDKLGYSYNRFIVMFTTDKSFADHSGYFTEIKNSMAGLKKFPLKHKIIYPDDKNKQISKDKHAAYAVVMFSGNKELENEQIEKFKSLIKTPPNLEVKLGGEPIFLQDTKVQTQRDLYKTEYVATPVAIVTMLLVFGSVIAALLPIILGGITALIILVALFVLGHYFSLSVFTLNIALLLGLCLSLDYSLLIISRYRDELHKGENVRDAIAVTQATAAKSVFFSGLAVFISLSALLFFPINVLFSVGIGGLAAVLVSVMIAVILLPALLAILNHKINLLPVRLFKSNNPRRSYWHWSVKKIIKRPFLFAITILIGLLILGYPFLDAKIGISNFKILPKGLESREVFDTFSDKFGENKVEPIFLIAQTSNDKILTKKNIGNLFDLNTRLKKDKDVKEITSIVYTNPRLTKDQYQMMYTQGKDRLPDALKTYLDITTKDNLTVMTIVTKKDNNSPETKNLIARLRDIKPNKTMVLKVTGGSANVIDVNKSIMKSFPYALTWIVVCTYLILLMFLRSIILPLKAIFTTMLSLCASYGVLVLVFQYGYLHNLLNFETQGMLDISLLVIIFCALFGVSMDYEVFLLTRIKEYYEKTGDNIQSIVSGIEHSSRIITSAAIIVILICFSFLAADIILVKAFGLGIAVAVFVDAFIIRTVFVPAVMTMLGKWNWYLPAWLNRILPQISFDPDHYPVQRYKRYQQKPPTSEINLK